jgi:hypothetical protein
MAFLVLEVVYLPRPTLESIPSGLPSDPNTRCSGTPTAATCQVVPGSFGTRPLLFRIARPWWSSAACGEGSPGVIAGCPRPVPSGRRWCCARNRARRKVIAAVYHGRQHGERQEVTGIEQSVIRGKAVKLEGEMHHFKMVVAQQLVSETEPTVQHVSRDHAVEMQRDEPAGPFPFFHHSQCKTRHGYGDELAQKASVYGQEG